MTRGAVVWEMTHSCRCKEKKNIYIYIYIYHEHSLSSVQSSQKCAYMIHLYFEYIQIFSYDFPSNAMMV